MRKMIRGTLLWVAIVTFFIIGCAAKVTRESLDPLDTFPPMPAENKRVEIRYFYKEIYIKRRKDASGSFNIFKNQEMEKILAGYLQERNAFSKVDVVSFSSDSMSATTEDSEFEKKVILAPALSSQSDYFVDFNLVVHRHYEDPNGQVLLGLIQVLSLGFIPIFKDSDLHLEVIVYKKASGTSQKYEVQNDIRAWYWTPFLFFPAAKKFSDSKALMQEPAARGFKSLVAKMIQEGAFK